MISLLCGSPWAGRAAENPPAGQAEDGPVAPDAHAEHGLPPHATEIFHVGPLPITNSMLVCWVVAIGLIIFARYATRNIREVPDGAQNFWEWLVESLYNFLEGIIGSELVKKTYWFFATIFIFILFCNWFGLIPGVGTIGWGEKTAHGTVVSEPWLRGVNADLNMTLAMACIFFACWCIWAWQANGPIGLLKHLFAPQGRILGRIEGHSGNRVFRGRVFGNRFDLVPTGFAELPVVWEHFRGRKHAGVHVPAGAGAGLAVANSVLFHGIAGRARPGARVHAVDGGLYDAHHAARR
jgi:hypothetical protein